MESVWFGLRAVEIVDLFRKLQYMVKFFGRVFFQVLGNGSRFRIFHHGTIDHVENDHLEFSRKVFVLVHPEQSVGETPMPAWKLGKAALLRSRPSVKNRPTPDSNTCALANIVIKHKATRAQCGH